MARSQSPDVTTLSVREIVLRKQARYCYCLAARNADPRISAALRRMGRRLTAQARAAAVSRGQQA